MDDLRQKLLRQIREIRGRIDPRVLARAQAAAEAGQGRAATAAPRAHAHEGKPADAGARRLRDHGSSDTAVPYDKATARQAVQLFLQRRADQGRFALDLMDRMKRPEEAAQAYEQRRPIVVKR